MFNHFAEYNRSLSWCKTTKHNQLYLDLFALARAINILTRETINRNIVDALAKSNASDWRRYYTVTQARHYFKSVLFLCLQFPVYMVGCTWSFMLATSVCSTPTRAVCHPYWRRGCRFNLLYTGGHHA